MGIAMGLALLAYGQVSTNQAQARADLRKEAAEAMKRIQDRYPGVPYALFFSSDPKISELLAQNAGILQQTEAVRKAHDEAVAMAEDAKVNHAAQMEALLGEKTSLEQSMTEVKGRLDAMMQTEREVVGKMRVMENEANLLAAKVEERQRELENVQNRLKLYAAQLEKAGDLAKQIEEALASYAALETTAENAVAETKPLTVPEANSQALASAPVYNAGDTTKAAPKAIDLPLDAATVPVTQRRMTQRVYAVDLLEEDIP